MSDFDFLTQQRKPKTPEANQTPAKKTTLSKHPPKVSDSKKIGRPANGKRSDPDWVGRTFYVEAETDANFGIAIATIKAQGIPVDKSDIVQALLSDWMSKEPEAKLKWSRSRFS